MSQHAPDPAMTMGYKVHSAADPHDARGPNGSLNNQVLNRALEEIIGSSEVARLGDTPSIADLARELEVRFGQQPGRGIAVRVGGICFIQMVRRIGDQAGLTQPSFRLLPLPLRLRQGLLAFRDLLSDFGGMGIGVEEQDGRLFWRLQDCPICAGRDASEPICCLMLGMLKEAMSWLSGGRYFDVQEIACHGRGDEDCIFEIDPIPMDL